MGYVVPAAPERRARWSSRAALPRAERSAVLRLPRLVSVLAALFLLLVGSAFVMRETGNLPYRVYIVHTGSMIPTIPPESAVIVREHEYHVGEVISFVEHDNVVSHRLMAIGRDGRITTKGDGNRTADPWHVPTSDIIGGVVAAPRHLGYLLTYLRYPAGAASILLGLLCLWQVWALAGEFSEKRPSESAVLRPRQA